ncbi:YiaA/YiaB family inner membrane protein [Paenibacillus albus]|uniref:YiaA/YiaB family inner membrane protein n=1 Tax=Paenibacillus albus TaxID=2495582 RepID=UPI001D13209B|nr:YiaA/YiaB family inner membrane protein [Paenibacillus albus]
MQTFNAGYRRRNTSAFTFLSWAGFVLAILAEYIGVFNLEEPFSVKGYYAIGGAFLIVSCLVLQKTIRDNEEDKLHSGPDAVDESVN